MGVYHFAGLGCSIGAVTAAFSYLAALRATPGGADHPIFAGSGQADLDPAYRGAVQALVLFSTAEVLNNSLAGKYHHNEAGRTGGTPVTGKILAGLKGELQRELVPLARREQRPGDTEGHPTGPPKPLELYLCEVDLQQPVQTFERALRTVRATKPPGDVGHEMWINLTGGSNIINSALQMAASLTGVPARQYYLLSEDTACIRHTVPPNRLGTEYDTFWVDVPLTFLDFNPRHIALLNLLAELAEGVEEVDLGQLSGLLPEQPSDLEKKLFRHTYLRPLVAQRLVVCIEENGRSMYRTGPAWARAERFYDVLGEMTDDAPRSLGALAKQAPWLSMEMLPITD